MFSLLRTSLAAAALFGSAIAGTLATAHAQGAAWPARPVTIVVPFGAGGGVDVIARIVGQKLGDRLGQNVVIENVAGAGGALGTQRVARAEPDGYTLALGVESTMIIAKLVQPNVIQYDGLTDFAPVALIGETPIALLARKEFPAANVADLLTLLRNNPGRYSFATSGVGSSLHLAGEMINLQGKVQMNHLPYRSGAQIVTDIAAGHIDLAIITLVTALPPARAGQAKILGLTGKAQSPLAPEFPPLASTSELSGVDISAWYGLFAPAKTSAAVIERLAKEMTAILADTEMKTRLAGLTVGAPPATTPEAFGAYIARENEKFSAIVKAANVKVE